MCVGEVKREEMSTEFRTFCENADLELMDANELLMVYGEDLSQTQVDYLVKFIDDWDATYEA